MLNESAIPDPDGVEKVVAPPPTLLNFYDLPLPPDNDPNELLKHRFLCRGGAILLVGPTGIGKSSFALQCAVLWSLGREAFGIVPARALRVLIVQAENDLGDMAEFREGIMKGLSLSAEDCHGSVIQTVWEDTRTGPEFCEQVLKPVLEQQSFDLVVIDPALAYLGADANQQKDVSIFLRNSLNPVLHRAGCGLVLVHHTNKPPTGTERPAWQAGDFAYIGSGSAEWANWARGVLAIRSIGSNDYFELRAGKRGKRLRWTEEDFATPAYTKIIAHGSVGICWREASMEEFKAAGGSELMKLVAHKRSGPNMDEFLAIFPIGYKSEPRYGLLSADQIKKVFLDRGWQKDLYRAMCDNAEADGLLTQIKGDGRGGQILRGLPAIAEAFLEHKNAKGSILEEVPLAKPVVRRKAKKRR